jgi:hypothetical protein
VVRHRLLLYVLVLAVVAAVLALILWTQSEHTSPPVASTHIAGPHGLKALYLVLESEGVQVRRWRSPLSSLPLGGRRRLLVLAAPCRRGIGETEGTVLRSWVSRGNTLVWLRGGGEPLSQARRICPGLGHTNESALERALGLPPELRSDEDAKAYEDEELLPPWKEVALSEAYLPATPGSGYTDGVELLNGGRLEGRASDAPQGWIPMAGIVGESPVVLRRKIGTGTVFLFPGPRFLANGWLAREDNLEFFLNILRLHRPGVVLFDEYHHGYGSGAVGTLVGGRVASEGFWHLLALAVVYFLARGIRLGPPAKLQRDERRPAADYIRALANLMKKGRKGPEMAQSLHASFRSRLERRVGLSRRLGDREIARRIEERWGVEGARLAPALERARRGEMRSARELKALARLMRRVEKEVEQWSRR